MELIMGRHYTDFDMADKAVRAMSALIDTIDATGGVRGSVSRNRDGTIHVGHCHPVGDDGWGDLADAYLLACVATSTYPLINDTRYPVDRVTLSVSLWNPEPSQPAGFEGAVARVKNLRTHLLLDAEMDDLCTKLDQVPELKAASHYFLLALASLEHAQHYLGLAALSSKGVSK